MSPANRQEMFRRLAAANPDPQSELEYGSPYQLLAAVLLSAQATDKSVNIVTRRLFPLASTPQAMVELGLENITEAIRTIGLFRNKAKNLLAMSQILIDQHGGEVPDDRAALEALPGVGRKTANVVLNVAFGHPTIAVDTHIFRVSNRTGEQDRSRTRNSILSPPQIPTTQPGRQFSRPRSTTSAGPI